MKKTWMDKFCKLNQKDLKNLRKHRKMKGMNKIFEEEPATPNSPPPPKEGEMSDANAAIEGPFCGDAR